MCRLFVFGLALLCSFGHWAQAATTTQLPRGVVPTHYAVAITPDAAHLTFTATATVSIQVTQPTRSITLHAADLMFSQVELEEDSGAAHTAPVRATAVRLSKDAQTATFEFGRALHKGGYRLRMDYSGFIGTQATGLFALDYTSTEGAKRSLYTQFENSDARRFIPCWDEPAFKATFAFEATVPANEMAVSNMPVAGKEDLGNGQVRVRFQTSPRMSPYLLFFALGDFERASVQQGNTDVGVITKKGSLAQADFVLAASKDILAQYNDYFGVTYPLPKLDNIAAPGQSQFFGAMENWGAIFTFEHAMLLDPKFSSPADRHRAFSIAAHEMAHQWFGNLVTMQWWDDLWLNEGFASWMESRTTSRLHPEWHTALNAVGGRDWAMDQDALKTTHPVVQHVATVEQARQAFDAITYQKGGAVIRMLEAYVGEETWRSGVRSYMKKYAYGNTQSDDFWREIDAVAGVPVSRIAHDFTLKPGVPMIRVGPSRCINGQSAVELSQAEFSNDQPHKKALTWQVPVIAQGLNENTQVRTLVKGGRAMIVVPGCAPVVVNAGQSGYYRTLYAHQDFRMLVQHFFRLAPVDQLGLLSDSWALGNAGLQPASDFLDLAVTATSDSDPHVWERIAKVLVEIDEMYQGATASETTDPGEAVRRARFSGFAIKTLTPALARVGWKPLHDEPSTVAILRNTLILALSSLGDSDTVAQARALYAKSVTDASAVSAEMRKTILAAVARHADAASWDAMHAQALAENTRLVKDHMYIMLAASEDVALARRALDLALSPEPGATTSAAMIKRVAVLHPQLAFDFAVAHRAAINEKVDTASRARYYPGLVEHAADPALITKLQAFATAYIAASSRRGAETAVARIGNNIRVRRDRLPVVDKWLASRNQ